MYPLAKSTVLQDVFRGGAVCHRPPAAALDYLDEVERALRLSGCQQSAGRGQPRPVQERGSRRHVGDLVVGREERRVFRCFRLARDVRFADLLQ